MRPGLLASMHTHSDRGAWNGVWSGINLDGGISGSITKRVAFLEREEKNKSLDCSQCPEVGEKGPERGGFELNANTSS